MGLAFQRWLFQGNVAKELGPKWIERLSYFWPIYTLTLAILGLAGIWILIAEITKMRLALTQFTGDSFPDNAWGFGQKWSRGL